MAGVWGIAVPQRHYTHHSGAIVASANVERCSYNAATKARPSRRFADRLRVNLMDIACVAQILVEIHCCQGEGSRADQFETLFVGMW